MNSRYRFERNIGEGGMGKVDLVYDRIEKKHIALKTITSKEGKDIVPLRESLIQEFKILASINHPNIVSVLDFGFNESGMPFFTMEYLEGAVDVVGASLVLGYDDKINKIIEVLQGLQFLHRRSVLHRDLKPENILIANGTTKILDFGLSILAQEAANAAVAGTVAYMSPEALQGNAVSVSSDLFAIGYIIFQMFNNGQHPFPLELVNVLVFRMIQADPNFDDLDVDESLLNIIRKLVEKQPADRYQDAHSVISDLLPLSKKLTTPETVEVRDSYLTSAPFVGRTTPLNALLDALHETLNGKGQIQLVGGISGIGKSRLLDELRIHALVKNVLVLRGYTRQGAAQPYDVWQKILAHLCLLAPLTDSQAAILKPLVPEIGAILERDIPDAPALADEKLAEKRLLDVIGQMLAQTTQPLLLILEDLHWIDDSSHTLLKHLIPMMATSPVMIVASYRDDEKPDLPATLPGVPQITLERLSNNSIAELARKMLGAAANHPDVTDFLIRESDGNAYFLVEIIRELAQQAQVQGLGQIGIDTLPDKVFPSGIRDIVKRQLERLTNPAMKDLLTVAALDGTIIDLDVLRRLAKADTDTNVWLANCAGVGILERDGDDWRFTHNKLRELLLEELDVQQSRRLHAQLAQEKAHLYRVHRDLRRGQEAHIAAHFEQAQQLEQAGIWYFHAAQHAVSNYATRIACSYFEKAQQYIPREDNYETHIQIYRGLGNTQRLLLQLEAAEEAFQSMLQLSEQSQADNIPIEAILQALFGLTEVYRDMGNYPQMIVCARRAMDFADMLGATATNLQVVDIMGSLAMGLLNTQKYEAARQVAIEAREMLTKIPVEERPRRMIRTLNALGQIDFRLWERFYHKERAILHLPIAESFALQKKHIDNALLHFEQAVQAARELGHDHTLANVVNNLGWVYMADGQLGKAIDCFQEAMDIFIESGAELGLMVVHINLARLFNEFQMYDLAESIILQVLASIINTPRFFGMLEAYDHLTTALYMQGKYGNALEYISEWLQHALTTGDTRMIGLAWLRAGRIAYELGVTVVMDGTEREYTWQECFYHSEEFLTNYNRDRLQLLSIWAQYEFPNNEVQRVVGTLISELGTDTENTASDLFGSELESVVPSDEEEDETDELETVAARFKQVAAEPEAFVRKVARVNSILAARYIGKTGVYVSQTLKDEIATGLMERASNPASPLKLRIAAGKALGELDDPRFTLLKGQYGAYLLSPQIVIPAASYRIGDDTALYDDEHPAHQLELNAFQLGQFPVTNAEYQLFIKAGGYDDEQWWATPLARDWRNGKNATEGHKELWRANWQTIRRWSLADIDEMVMYGLISEPIAQAWKAIRQMEQAEIDNVLEKAYPHVRPVTQPAFWDDRDFNHVSQPVVGVSWFEANAYCNWLSAQTGKTFRLPSEAEWEAAARGKDGRLYAYGDAYNSARGNTAENQIQRTTPISVFSNRENTQALNDITGNVWEWTLSAYAPYPYIANDGREDDGQFVRRVLRGHSWSDYLSNTKSTVRYRHYPTFRHNYFGFRLVCE